MSQIAICDDDFIAGNQIRSMAELAPREHGIKASCQVYQSPAVLLAELRSGLRYDLYLLDILMGAENGVELARTLRAGGNRAKLVFVNCGAILALISSVLLV